jgi:hypothetical protein
VLLFGSDYLILIIPIVVALFGWILAVFWASTHPRVRHLEDPAREVLAAGAADEGDEAGSGAGPVPPPRQQVPEPPPAQRPAPPAPANRTGSAPGR